MPRTLKGKALEAYKNRLDLNYDQRDVLVGSLLGDGFLKYHRNTKVPMYHFEFAQGVVRANYVHHMYQIFKPFVGTPPTINLIGGIKPGLPKRYEARFKTYSHACFKPYDDLFYTYVDDKHTKRVPENIGSMLTPRGLAYWYMDDGNQGRSKHRVNYYNFSCHGFTFDQAVLLQEALSENFKLESKVRRDHNKPRLYISRQSHADFYHLIKPYIVPCVRYKL